MKIAEFVRVRVAVGIVFVFLLATIFSFFTTASASSPAGHNFGMVCNPYNEDWASPDKTVALFKDMGIKLAICKMSWRDIEKEKGKCPDDAWKVSDGVVDKFTSNGIDVMFIIADTPMWAIDPAVNSKNWEGKKFGPPPKEPKDLASFVSTAVKRYKNKVKTWALFNAPQNKNHWTTPAHLAALYKASYEAVKKEQPEGILVMSGLEGDSQKIRGKYLEGFLEAGGGKYVDMYDFHLLFNQSPISVVESWTVDFKDILKKYGEHNKPIQYGAIGWVSSFDPPNKWKKKKAGMGWKSMDCIPLTPEMQACRLVNTVVTGKSLGIERIFWTRTRDHAPSSGPEYQKYVDKVKAKKPNYEVKVEATISMGIVDFDYKPKPAYQALKVLVEKLEGASFVKSLDMGAGGKGYLFKKGNKFTGVVWLWEGSKNIELSVKTKSIQVVDMYGKPVKTISVTKRKCSLTVTNVPVYLEGVVEDVEITSLLK